MQPVKISAARVAAFLSALWLAAALAAPMAASAYTITPVENGIYVQREAADATTVPLISISSGYLGGANITAAYPPFATSSYSPNTTLLNQTSITFGGVLISLPEGVHRIQIGTVYWVFDIERDQVASNIGTMPAVSVSALPTATVNVHTMPQVSLSGTASVSIAETLPVSVESVGSVDKRGLGLLIGASALALGLAFGKAVKVW